MWPRSSEITGPPHRMTHYDALRVSPTATLLEIKASHRSSVLRLHPDRRRGEAEKEEEERPMTLPSSSSNERGKRIEGPSKSVDRDLCRNDHEEDEDTTQQSQFLRVQAAWECLRDPDRRREYDESLRRRRARTEARFDKAVVVRLSEMDCEVCDVEMDCKEDDDDVEVLEDGQRVDETVRAANVQKVYTYPCRCGDCFEVLEEELSESPTNVTRPRLDEHEQSLPGRVWECQSCSLTICIEMDVPIE